MRWCRIWHDPSPWLELKGSESTTSGNIRKLRSAAWLKSYFTCRIWKWYKLTGQSKQIRRYASQLILFQGVDWAAHILPVDPNFQGIFSTVRLLESASADHDQGLFCSDEDLHRDTIYDGWHAVRTKQADTVDTEAVTLVLPRNNLWILTFIMVLRWFSTWSSRIQQNCTLQTSKAVYKENSSRSVRALLM